MLSTSNSKYAILLICLLYMLYMLNITFIFDSGIQYIIFLSSNNINKRDLLPRNEYVQDNWCRHADTNHQLRLLVGPGKYWKRRTCPMMKWDVRFRFQYFYVSFARISIHYCHIFHWPQGRTMIFLFFFGC